MSDLNNAHYWRHRAEEARGKAGKMRDPDARRYLLGIARSFDLLAERAQKGAAPENEVLA
jgi:hypothetical protein